MYPLQILFYIYIYSLTINQCVPGDEELSVRSMAVKAIESIDKYYSKATMSWRIRPFERPLIDFSAPNYYKMIQYSGNVRSKKFLIYKGPAYKGEQVKRPVTRPPLLEGKDIRAFLVRPFDSEIPCHSQAVERAVATTFSCVKKRKTEKGQMDNLLSTVAARKEPTRRVLKKRYFQDFARSTGS